MIARMRYVRYIRPYPNRLGIASKLCKYIKLPLLSLVAAGIAIIVLVFASLFRIMGMIGAFMSNSL